VALKLKSAIASSLEINLKLTLNDRKTKITNPRTGFKFLGFTFKTITSRFRDRNGLRINMSPFTLVVSNAQEFMKKLLSDGFCRRAKRNSELLVPKSKAA
jgi:hypothetical protein